MILADLHRRAGEFGKVAAVARERQRPGLAASLNEVIRQALDFEMRLAEGGDASCHSIGELECVRRVQQARVREYQQGPPERPKPQIPSDRCEHERQIAERKGSLQRIVSGDHTCPDCRTATTQLGLVKSPFSSEWFILCLYCGGKSRWKGEIPA